MGTSAGMKWQMQHPPSPSLPLAGSAARHAARQSVGARLPAGPEKQMCWVWRDWLFSMEGNAAVRFLLVPLLCMGFAASVEQMTARDDDRSVTECASTNCASGVERVF